MEIPIILGFWLVGLACFGLLICSLTEEEEKEPEISIKNPYYRQKPLETKICVRCKRRPAKCQRSSFLDNGLCNTCEDIMIGLS